MLISSTRCGGNFDKSSVASGTFHYKYVYVFKQVEGYHEYKSISMKEYIRYQILSLVEIGKLVDTSNIVVSPGFFNGM